MIKKLRFCFPSRSVPSSFALLIISIQCYEVTIHLVFDYFWHLKLTIRITGRGDMVGIKLKFYIEYVSEPLHSLVR